MCPDPGFYFSTATEWLDEIRRPWADRQRTSRSLHDVVHFLLDGRDGYLEIAAEGFTWRAWVPGSTRLNEVSGPPSMSGAWAAPQS